MFSEMSLEVCVDDDSSSSSSIASTAPSPSTSSITAPTQTQVDRPSTSNRQNRKRRFGGQTLSRINFGSNLSSQSESGSSNSLNSVGLTSSSASEDEGDDASDKRIRLSSSSSVASQHSLEGRSSSVSPAPEPVSYDIADLECSQSSQRSNPYIKETESIIGDCEYELIGDGKECQAVNLLTNTIHICRVLNEKEYRAFMVIAERIEEAERKLEAHEAAELRRILLPVETRTVSGKKQLHYVISPTNHGNLQTHFSKNEKISELQTRKIFSQMVRLVDYCHRLGIYFRDFLLKKIVLADKETFDIRFMFSVNDLQVLPDLTNDRVELLKGCCPAFTAPEMMPAPNSKHHSYKASPANIWSLGVLLYNLVTGRAPFMARSPRDLFRLIKAAYVSFNASDNVSFKCKMLVYSILKANPVDRPTTEEILASEWLRKEEASGSTEFALHFRPSTISSFNEPGMQGFFRRPVAERDEQYVSNEPLRRNLSFLVERHTDQMALKIVPEQLVPDIDFEQGPDSLGLVVVP